MKSRILALALIGFMLSSSSISVANGYTISFAVTEVNGTVVNTIIQPNHYKSILSDGIAASLGNQQYDRGEPYRINLFDGILSILDKNYNDAHDKEKTNLRIISLEIADGVGATSAKYQNEDKFVKIISIKQDHDRRALWERIFPLDRIRSSEKQSLYKVIQDDNGLSHLQVNEFVPEQPEDAEFLLDTPFGNDIDKFFGKANYVAEQLADHVERLEVVDKFVGKSLYVGNQISVNAQRLTDVDKFVGKSQYLANAIVFEIERLSDAEKFIGKSQYVSNEITIQVYQAVDSKDSTLLLLVIPFAGFVLIRFENEKIKFYNVQQIFSFIFIIILLSSSVITPFT